VKGKGGEGERKELGKEGKEWTDEGENEYGGLFDVGDVNFSFIGTNAFGGGGEDSGMVNTFD